MIIRASTWKARGGRQRALAVAGVAMRKEIANRAHGYAIFKTSVLTEYRQIVSLFLNIFTGYISLIMSTVILNPSSLINKHGKKLNLKIKY